MKYRVLLFDADNTLLDFTKTEEQAFVTTMKNHGYPHDTQTKAVYDVLNHDLWKKYERGEITREEVVNTRFGKLFAQMGVTGDGVLFEQEYQEMLGTGSFLIEGAVTLLEEVKKAGYQIYIVTNGVAKTQYRRLKESGISDLADGIFISEELGYQKPSKKFFDIVFDKIGEEFRTESLIIGDSLTSDILGGNNAGIKTCWLNPEHHHNEMDASVDYEIAQLDDLYDILDVKRYPLTGNNS